MLVYNFSNHFYSRISLRNIKQNDVNLCLIFGDVIYKTGIRFYILSKKKIIENSLSEKLEGLCVLVSRDNFIITAYRNKSAISKTKRLSKLNFKKNSKEKL